jgi:hypothetical protein
MRAAREFIKFKIQISKFKGEKRGGSEGEKRRRGEGEKRLDVGEEREILSFEF